MTVCTNGLGHSIAYETDGSGWYCRRCKLSGDMEDNLYLNEPDEVPEDYDFWLGRNVT